MHKLYFPTSDCDEATSLSFYEKNEKQIQNLGGRRDRVTIVMGDFNSSVGEGEKADVVGSFGYGRRNEKGQLLVDYCKEKRFVIRSTFGVQAKKRRHTWIRPDGNFKLQIDHIYWSIIDIKTA